MNKDPLLIIDGGVSISKEEIKSKANHSLQQEFRKKAILKKNEKKYIE